MNPRGSRKHIIRACDQHVVRQQPVQFEEAQGAEDEVMQRVDSRRARDPGFVLSGLQAGELRPVVAKTFPFEQIVDAHRYIDSGEQFGKVMVTV